MTLKERLRRRLCAFWWAFREGRPQGKITIPSTGLRPQHLAIIMPPEFHDFDVALPILEPLVERLNPRDVTLLVRENFRTWISRDLGFRMVCFDFSQQNWLGFPKDNFTSKLRDLNADVVINLTPGFSPFTAGLTAATGAPLRVSLDIEEWNEFYNFFIRQDEARTLAERYHVLLRYV